MSKNDLREVFYQCQYQFLNRDEVLFEAGEICKAIYVVIVGTIDVELTDGDGLYHRLDSLGPNSILGTNFVFKKEPWYYRVKNNSNFSCQIMKLTFNNIQTIMSTSNEKKEQLREYIEMLGIKGLPQIDYIIGNFVFSKEDVIENIKNH